MAESAELEAVTSDLLEQHKREVKDLRGRDSTITEIFGSVSCMMPQLVY